MSAWQVGETAASPDTGSFRFACTSALRWRQWGDELVVYDARQARTHLLGAGPADVLMHLSHQELALTLGELVLALLVDPDGGMSDAPSDDEQHALAGCVDTLVRLGLVEARPS